ncbi:MAG: hypothetical protein A2X11_02210 [Bacteroidetes bacterium GWE2_42_24]|nr:MAG: hypothetical protein A2X11_02210 [Bacteroidetes bacterium GWE2_42_24]OFY25725.1 MAG: hypothetical protein A2X09_13400 [Bacteroidetes bacterium GWF2_43_11]
MKKISTLLLAGIMATSAMVTAQSLQVLDKLGNQISNGEMITVGGPVEMTGVASVDVKNITDRTLNVMAKKQDLIVAADQVSTFCWLTCYPPFVTNPTDIVVIKSDSIFPRFTADLYTPVSNFTPIEVRYTFYVAEDPNDSVSVTFKYIPTSFAMKYGIEELSSGSVLEVTSPLSVEADVAVTVQNLNSSASDVLVRRTDLQVNEGTMSFFCWKLCYGPTTYVSPVEDSIRLQPQAISNNFSGHFNANGIFGSVVTRYTFFDSRNPADSSWFFVRFTAEGTGVNDPSSQITTSAYPNPASDFVTLNIGNMKSNGSVLIYNLTGSLVKQTEIAAGTSQVSVNVNDLPSGMYFYTLTTNGRTISSKKFVISR